MISFSNVDIKDMYSYGKTRRALQVPFKGIVHQTSFTTVWICVMVNQDHHLGFKSSCLNKAAALNYIFSALKHCLNLKPFLCDCNIDFRMWTHNRWPGLRNYLFPFSGSLLTYTGTCLFIPILVWWTCLGWSQNMLDYDQAFQYVIESL